MIAFSCSHCGMKFRVQDEFAGRQTRCPTCKQPLVVPRPDLTQAHVPDGPIDGPLSSVARAGLDGGVSLGQGDTSLPGQQPVAELLVRPSKGQRYVIEKEIARGGMGAVLRAVDCDIRREVAVKYLLEQTDPAKKQRFVEEAQITGQLEHPNIVPVHELGVDSQGCLFFSMKMVRGRSLAQVLKDLRDVPRIYEREWTLGRLLTIFVGVCNALAYAHARKVVHRDLKPANIMVGNFGEVYVMDWGLAKVLQEAPAVPLATVISNQTGSAPAAIPFGDGSVTAAPSGKVATNRDGEADLTQEGTVLGTPVYMPPEQATGNVQAIDQRSDVYSLGAILYELLTLQPPVDREGGHLAILLRVAQGEIVPPAQRVPDRWVPPELAAVAMKALAKDPKDRYPNVEVLRRDIERFQEGRSVSAKQDTTREVLWKLVKRNQGASLATAAALLVIAVILGFSIKLINDGRLEAVEERNRTKEAYAAYLQEQEAKRAQAKESVPVLLEAARFAVERRRFPEALIQATLAVDYDPDHAKARLLRARLLIAEKKDFPAAQSDLEKLLELRPGDAAGTQLLELCRTARAEDTRSIAAFAEAFLVQDEVVLAAHMVKTRDQQLAVYRKRIEKFWPNAKANEVLTMDKDGNCAFELFFKEPVMTDLEPLRGIPLTRLQVHDRHLGAPWRELRDLGALRGMPLTSLEIIDCLKVTDLTPLRGLKLARLVLLNNGPIKDLSPLKDMPLKELVLIRQPIPPKELNVLRGMPLTKLTLQDRDGGGHSFLSDLPRLTHLDLTNTWNIGNLTHLEGLKLKSLILTHTDVRDLTKLASMPLEYLDFDLCDHLSDLTPLSKIPTLTTMKITRCPKVKKLSPLAGLKLKTIWLEPKQFPPEEMGVLRGMKLTHIATGQGAQYTAENFWKKYDAGGFGK